jgi:hypothetical protein
MNNYTSIKDVEQLVDIQFGWINVLTLSNKSFFTNIIDQVIELIKKKKNVFLKYKNMLSSLSQLDMYKYCIEVKPSHAVTSIKQTPVLEGHPFLVLS